MTAEPIVPPSRSAFDLRFVELPPGCRAEIETSSPEPGVTFALLRLTFGAHAMPPSVRLAFTFPTADVHAHWNPITGLARSVEPPWGPSYVAKATSGAPVHMLHAFGGENRLTMALADATNATAFRALVCEETATFDCELTLFAEPAAPIDRYETVLRLDTRARPFADTLTDVASWWAELPAYPPMAVPAIARAPMYSTWYSFHQNVTAADVEAECRLARELGCEAVIMDDGWQTTDNRRGYGYCGDWQVTTSKIPDMATHVRRVHDMGMKYLLWYSVPFVGRYSPAHARFEGKYLAFLSHWNASVLDPRFPEVREYLIGTYETAVNDWDVDGLKLDFIDSFNFGRSEPPRFGEGRDYDAIPQAIDRLMTDVHARLRPLKPDLVIEFRQKYVGPAMRKYGNMFRGHDVPNDPLGNRVECIDVRLLCGRSAAHADMMMWHPGETPEGVALHLMAALFAVPQISVQLRSLPPEHLEVLRFWLAFWREQRDVLLDGRLTPMHPEALYPAIRAESDRTELLACYVGGHAPLTPSAARRRVLLLNATVEPALVVEAPVGLGRRRLVVRDCRGRVLRDERVTVDAGIARVDVPRGGVASWETL